MRITVIEHEAGAGLGYFADWLGVPCEIVRPYLGEAVPERAADGLIVLGGAPSAWDDEGAPWLPATRDLLRRSVEAGTPTLGICLGAQLMTIACGGTVERGTEGREVGARLVTPLPAAAGDRLFRGIGPAVAVQGHQDVMTVLPAGAVLLATSEQYPHQAYRLGSSAWAVQFHPEATPEIFIGWTAADDFLAADGYVAEDVIAEVKAAEERMIAAWRPLTEAFADVVSTNSHGLELR